MKKLHLFKRTLLLLALIVGFVSYGWAAEGDEITSVANIINGQSYYIKGVRSEKSYYLKFTDTTGSQSGTESSTTSEAQLITFHLVSKGVYTLETASGHYIAPGTSNGKINVSADAINVTATNQDSKIRLSIKSGNNTWSIQKNTSAANFGGYKNTQTDITLIEGPSAKTLKSISVATAPKKTAYKIGETLDLTGIVVTGTFDDSSTEDVTSKCSFDPVDGAVLGTAGNQNVAISYNDKNCNLPITVASVTGLAVKTAPTTVKYRIGDNLDLTGLELTATYSDGGTKDITDFTASLADGSALNTSGNVDVTLSYYGQTCTQRVTVGTLSSLTYNSGIFANTTYTEKDFFDPTGLVVTAHYSNSDGLEEVIDDYILTPSTETALSTTNDKVVVSYTWAETEQTVNIPITVNAGTKYTVTYNGGAGTPAKSSDTETEYKGGVTLPSATIELDGWVFAGWATAPTASTTTRPTLYKSGSPYYPNANTTLYAVYTLEGIDGTKYQRVTELSEATSASSMIFVDKVNSKVFKYNGNDVTYGTAPTETNGQITPSDDIVWTLDGNNTDGYNVKTTSLETNRSAGFDTPAESTNYANIKTYPSNSVSNGLWKFVQSKKGSDLFTLRNNTEKLSGYVGSLRFYASNSKWQVYYLAASGFDNNDNTALKLYVPVKTAYNSNPDAAIIQPTVGFEKGNTTLYLVGTTTYTNAASVTGVDKSVTGYRSSNENVATVAADGTVTAVGIGTATITAYLDAELGVHKAAQATYDVVVKTTTTIAGLKTIDNNSGVAFAADLTDAVVTYVSGDYAYIQDASAAILVNKSKHGLIAGQKINGAVSGTVKTSYSIDQLTAIDLLAATVTEDGAIPTALTKTVAEVRANAASLDGQLVTINAVTIDKSNTTTTLKDGSKIGEVEATITMYSPNSGASVNDKEKGNFTGFVSFYNGETPRINLYEPSQFVKTHNAPTAQTLSFEGGNEAFDEVTSELSAFTGKSVEGAYTAVTYSKVDASSIIGDFNTETGALTLNGACGTATITATAVAGDVVEEAGVITPYLTANTSYTITVNPRYMVTFSVNGVETVLRQATSGASINVPTPAAVGDYKFRGWSTSTVAPIDEEPSMASVGAKITPANNDTKYYAVFANQTQTGAGGLYELDYSTDNVKCSGYGAADDVTASDGSKWVVKAYDNSGMQINKGKNSTIKVPTCPGNITSVVVTCSSANKNEVGFSASDYTGSGTITYLASGSTSTSQTLDLSEESVKGGYVVPKGGVTVITHIVVNYGPIITYSDYRTSLPTVEVTITDAQYATFCYERELDVEGTGVTAYTASANGEGKAVTLTKISNNIIPANTGVILFAERAGNYEINVSETGKEDEAIAGNELVGVITRTQIPETSADKYNYILSKKDDVIGFYRASGAYLLPNRAYLSTSTKGDAAAREFMAIMFDEGETTSLREVRGLKADVRGEFYNLNGQRVATPVKGNIYIVNGKKVMFK